MQYGSAPRVLLLRRLHLVLSIFAVVIANEEQQPVQDVDINHFTYFTEDGDVKLNITRLVMQYFRAFLSKRQ
jgi:hypothetical protein